MISVLRQAHSALSTGATNTYKGTTHSLHSQGWKSTNAPFCRGEMTAILHPAQPFTRPSLSSPMRPPDRLIPTER